MHERETTTDLGISISETTSRETHQDDGSVTTVTHTRRAFLVGAGAAAGATAIEAALPFTPVTRRNIEARKSNQTVPYEEEIKDTAGNVAGRFYTQLGDEKETGFLITNQQLEGTMVRFWDAFKRLGGVDVLGYPFSRPFVHNGFYLLALQGGVLQYNNREGSPDGVVLLNSFDELHSLIRRAQPSVAQSLRDRGVPTHREGDFTPAERLQWLTAGYYSDPDQKARAEILSERYTTVGGQRVSLEEAARVYGYPTSEITDFGLFAAVRCQRAGFQLWQQEIPGQLQLPRRGSITSFLTGDLLREFGWIPQGEHLIPQRLPAGGPEIAPDDGLSIIGRIETKGGGYVEFYQHRDSELEITFRDINMFNLVSDKYASGKRVKIVILPSTFVGQYEGIPLGAVSTGTDVSLNGQLQNFTGLEGFDQNRDPGIGIWQSGKSAAEVIAEANRTDNQSVSRIFIRRLGTLIARAGGGLYVALGIPQEAITISNFPQPPVQIRKRI